jgi:hypothetical protein
MCLASTKRLLYRSSSVLGFFWTHRRHMKWDPNAFLVLDLIWKIATMALKGIKEMPMEITAVV